METPSLTPWYSPGTISVFGGQLAFHGCCLISLKLLWMKVDPGLGSSLPALPPALLWLCKEADIFLDLWTVSSAEQVQYL